MSEWKEYNLSEVAHLVKDTYKPKIGDHLPYIGLEHIQEQGLRLLSIGDSDSVTSQKFHFKHNDVLFGKLRPYFRKVVKPNFAGVCSTDIWVVRALEGNDQNFIFYFFANQEFVDTANSGDSGTRMPRADWHFVKDTIWQFAPLPEQRAIAGVLSSLDDKIDLLHRQNKTLEGMAEALWRKMFVEEADPGWKKGKLGDMIITIESGRRPKGGIDPDLQFGIPSIGAENIIGIGNYEHNKTKYVSEEFYYKMNSGKVQDYDVLIYKDGAYIGRKSMFARGFPFKQCCVNEHVFILRTKDINTQIFLYFLLEQEELEQLNANSAQPGLNQESMKSFEIFIPNEKYIEKFGSETKAIIDKIFFNSIQIRTLSRLRDTLLPRLMSGEARVRIGALHTIKGRE